MMRTGYKVSETERSTRRIELLWPARGVLQTQSELAATAYPVPFDLSGRDHRALQSELAGLDFGRRR